MVHLSFHGFRSRHAVTFAAWKAFKERPRALRDESMSTDDDALPEYEQPPVVEVVCGVAFSPVAGFAIPHIGLFWQQLGSDFPGCQEVDPLATVIERDTEPNRVELNFTGPLPVPRVWFLHRNGDQIVQLQRDRFLCNWRKTEPDHVYPRYAWVAKQFRERLALFDAFVTDRFPGRLDLKQYELTYINHIPANSVWQDLADLGRVLPDFSWRSSQDRFLPTPERVDAHTTFALPASAGRLHVRLHNSERVLDGVPVLVLELTARGFGPDRDAWFELAHNWIVRGFSDLTESSIQSNVWRRTR
jgi:uncharacterized protein (TIGR04255 family)